MGEELAVICRDCGVFCDLDKAVLTTAYTEESFEEWMSHDFPESVVRKVLIFLVEHRGCNVSLVGEYGIHQSEFFRTSLNWEEFKEWER